MLDVFVAVGEVGVVPIHPHAQTDGLIGYPAGESQHPISALSGEPVQTELLDLALRVQAQVALYLHLDP